VSSRAAREAERARQQAEALAAELGVTTKRLRAAQSVAGVGIFDWDMRAQTFYWSDELFTLMGLAPGSLPPSFQVWDAV
ncbi:hypothetical protein, partial [Klebsiella pneumoniae]|uniref:hypothetical protein n=1 Tax=Klebsiella pneumoniae TaxID=573 RepID=UPI0030140299